MICHLRVNWLNWFNVKSLKENRRNAQSNEITNGHRSKVLFWRRQLQMNSIENYLHPRKNFQVLLSLFVKYNARKHGSKLFYKWKVSFERNVRSDKGLTLETSVSFISHGGNDTKFGTLLVCSKDPSPKILDRYTEVHVKPKSCDRLPSPETIKREKKRR